jgi:hypothetical protein
MEFIKQVVHTLLFLVKVTNFASKTLGIDIVPVFAPSKKFLSKDKDLLQ